MPEGNQPGGTGASASGGATGAPGGGHGGGGGNVPSAKRQGHVPKQPKFDGRIDALKGHVYDITGYKSQDRKRRCFSGDD